jgi:hypothetical protein
MNRLCASGQYQKRGLKRILRVVVPSQHLLADAPDEGSVPLDDFGKGVVVTVLPEAHEQYAVRVGNLGEFSVTSEHDCASASILIESSKRQIEPQLFVL